MFKNLLHIYGQVVFDEDTNREKFKEKRKNSFKNGAGTTRYPQEKQKEINKKYAAK